VRRAFTELVQAIVTSGNHFAAFAALRAAFPAVRDWLQNQLGESGAVAELAVQALIDAITPLIGPHLGEDLTSRVVSFVRLALADNAVLQLLRGIDAGELPERMDVDVEIDFGSIFGTRPRGSEEAAAFDVHTGVQCDGCNTTPIVGSRFRCETCPNYDLCSSCKMGTSHPEHEFSEFKYPWEASNETLVPPAPLGLRDRSPHVAHLQKLLTELGYMNERMYARRVGLFGPNTRKALSQFQREYGLQDNVVLGMYDDLTRGALFSIVDGSPRGRAGQPADGSDSGAGPSAATPPAQEASA
jgi:hypothetical protein